MAIRENRGDPIGLMARSLEARAGVYYEISFAKFRE